MWHGDGKNIDTVQGTEYNGKFEKGRRQGHGTYYDYNQRFSYRGEWKAGKYSGHGQEASWDHTRTIHYFDGHFIAGKREGFGRLHMRQYKYEGGWVKGKKEGYANEVDEGHDENYSGLFVNNLREGKGVLKMSGRYYKIYEGSFKAGQFEGQGIILYEGKKYYVGAFKNGRMHG